MASNDSEKVFSVDVECVATGRRHDDRDVCFVAVVDVNERVLLKKKVKPEKPVVSYLTPITGVREGDLDHAESLATVIAEVKKLLGPNAVLVGQGIKSDVKWLQLKEGEDYSRAVDLGAMFKTYNSRYRNYSFFSLAHEADMLLHAGFISGEHDPATDAIASIRLFNKYDDKPRLLEEAKQKLMSKRPAPSWAKRNGYKWEGVCMAAYMPEKCICGAPTLKN